MRGRVALLVLLDALPLRQNIAIDGLAREDVRVAADQLRREVARDVAQVERALLARELGVDDDLEEQVAELLAQPAAVAGVERVEDLVRLLEDERPQARVRLLAVPGAAVGRAQAVGDVRELRERLARAGEGATRARAR
jgi:hypothetical protein